MAAGCDGAGPEQAVSAAMAATVTAAASGGRGMRMGRILTSPATASVSGHLQPKRARAARRSARGGTGQRDLGEAEQPGDRVHLIGADPVRVLGVDQRIRPALISVIRLAWPSSSDVQVAGVPMTTGMQAAPEPPSPSMTRSEPGGPFSPWGKRTRSSAWAPSEPWTTTPTVVPASRGQ